MIILIVEDEPKVQELLRPYFEAQGHHVFVTETGEGALELIQRHPPDVVLLDMWLRGKMNGMSVLKETKHLSPQTSVVVITGLDEPPREEVVQSGAAAFLKKPIRLQELDQLLQQFRGHATTDAS